MTGRDLIIYILSNNLEDEPIYDENGRVLGFMTINEAASKFGVGKATIVAWHRMSMLDGVLIGDNLYIPVNAVVKGNSNDKENLRLGAALHDASSL